MRCKYLDKKKGAIIIIVPFNKVLKLDYSVIVTC